MAGRQRRECAVCGKELTVNKDGQLQRHQGTVPHALGHKRATYPGGNR